MRDAAVKLLLSAAAVLAPIQGMVITCLLLLLADLATGLMAARKNGTAITSSGLRRTAVKLFVYEAALVLGFITQKFLLGDAIAIVSIIAGFIGLTELLSIMENLNTISGSNLFKLLLKKLHQTKQP